MSDPPLCSLPNEFCFMDLRKGAKFIGFICLIFSLLTSIFLIIYLSQDIDDITREIADRNVEMKFKLDQHNSSARTTAGFLLALTILYFVSSILLLKGASDKSKSSLVPFLVTTILAIIASIIISVMQYNKGSFYPVLTIAVILFYFFICIFSLYKNFSVVEYER